MEHIQQCYNVVNEKPQQLFRGKGFDNEKREQITIKIFAIFIYLLNDQSVKAVADLLPLIQELDQGSTTTAYIDYQARREVPDRSDPKNSFPWSLFAKGRKLKIADEVYPLTFSDLLSAETGGKELKKTTLIENLRREATTYLGREP